MSSQLDKGATHPPDRVELRGGEGPPHPIWLDIQTHSTEWYRRFRVWHNERYPEADATSRANLDMLIELAEDRDRYRIEADCAMRDYEGLSVDYGRLRDDRDALFARAIRQPPHDYSGMGF